MSVSVDTLTPNVDATPGTTSHGRVIVHNLGSSEATFTVQVVGLDDAAAPLGPPTQAPHAASGASVSVPGNSREECVVPVHVPPDLAVGQHAAAFQITSSRATDRPVLVSFTVSVESIERLDLSVEPSPVRGGRNASFILGVHNGEPEPIAFTLGAEATDVAVRFKTPAFRLLPGERASTKAKVKGPRHLSGEAVQHNIVVSAHGKAATTTVTTPYIQRPVFARKLRMLVAALAVIALWLAAIGGVALWIANRDDGSQNDEAAASAADAASVQLTDANGDPLDNGPYTVSADGTLIDADGNPVDGFMVDENGNVVDDNGNPVNGVEVDPETGQVVDENGTPIGTRPPDSGDGSAGGGNDGVPGSGSGGGGDATAQGSAVDSDEGDGTPVSGVQAPTSTKLRGSVVAGGADLSDVTISLAPLDLGEQPPAGATVVDDGTPSQTSATKIWSARFAPIEIGIGSFRQTEPVAPLEAVPGIDGVWEISDVQLRRTYELSFAKPGFDTQAFVISPPDDGTPVELDVVLEPARGVISGRVIDNGSPLGGVEVSLSDGTLTFGTTSATDGDVGSFSFDSVSTPGVYTLVADRSGYGTSVVQVPLEPGEERTDVVVEMDAGVGSISGRIIGENGTSLGGIAVTATSGEMTRTTTTLTDGNVGFYSIPGLDVPGTYTVSVEAPGYLPQTRRVPISGSVGGINFALVDTTATLSGVVSSAGGGGIVGAAITLSNADLEFEVASASTPQPGAFVVENLPDGNYTVTIEHFQHETQTEFITVFPGVDPPPLLVTLPVRDLTVDAGTGSLVVEVIDPTGETPEERELTGADIALIETRTGIKKYELLDSPSFTAEFPEVAVGTYTILVTGVNGYNDSAARQVSIGQSQERRTIELLAFGAATGRMVDAITGEIITGYTVKFFEQDAAGGAEREIGQAEVNVASSSTGVWQTLPQVLPAGIYRIEIIGANGYEEPTKQVLDPAIGEPMQILILPAAESATEIPTLVANRYPDILGRVYEPRLVAGTDTEFDPIDDPDLEVGMRCDGGDLVPIPLSDELGAQPGDAFDSFFLSRQAVDNFDLLGACELEFAAPGYVTQVVDLPDVKVSSGNTLSDRVVNAALVKPVDDFGGRVFWVDDRNGTELPLGGVDISADAVTALDPTRAGAPPPGQIPTTRTTTIGTQSAADGTWTLNGQVFEDARYTFTTSEFAPGTLDVVIDENRGRTVTAVSGMNLTEVSSTSYDVELEPPFNGSVSGEITILSVDTKDYADVGIVGTDPFGNTANDTTQCADPDSGLCIDRSGADFTIANASAGTWTIDFDAPANHLLFDGAPGSVSQLLGPGQDVDGFDTTYVELGRVDVTAVDANTGDPITGGATLRVTGGGNPDLEEIHGAGTTGDYSIDGILVDDTSPETNGVSYNLEIVVGGYDSAGAQVSIDGGPNQTLDASTIPLTMFAGSKPQVRIELAPYGSILATTVGITNSVGAPADTNDLQPPDLIVDWNPVDQSGTVLTGFDRSLVSVVPVGSADFRLQGPPGYYQINVSHPQYEIAPIAIPVDNCPGTPTACRPDSPEPDVYRLENAQENDLTGRFELQVRRSQIDLSVFEDLNAATLVPVSGAEYTLTPSDGGTPLTGSLGTTGTATRTDLVPGVWALELRRYDSSVPAKNLAYPVKVNVNLGVSTDTATAVTTVRAPLAPIGGSIEGSLRAENSRGQPVALPQITIERDYDEPQIEVNGTLVDNSFPGDTTAIGDTDCQETTPSNCPTSSNTPNSGTQTFDITGLATGTHVLTFEEPAGYTFTSNSGNPKVSIDVLSSTAATVIATPYEYEVDDIDTVTATIQGLDANETFPGLIAKLVPSDLYAVDGCTADLSTLTKFIGTPTVESDKVVVTWSLIPPALDDYHLCTFDDLHANSDTAFNIPVTPRIGQDPTSIDLTPASPTPVPTDFVNPTATTARIAGALTKVVGGDTSDIVTGDAATLTLTGVATSVSPSAACSGVSNCVEISPATTPYEFDITFDPATNDFFTLELSKAGFAPDSVLVQLAPGREYSEPLEVTDQVRFDIEILNPTPVTPVDFNLKVQIARVEGGVTTTVQDMSESTPGSGDGRFTATVDRGSYYFLVTDDSLSQAFRHPASGEITPGSTVATYPEIDLTIPKTVSVNVTGIPNGSSDPTTVAVYANSAPTTLVTSKNVTGTGNTGAASTSFTSTGDGISATAGDGVLFLVVSNAGSLRARNIPIPAGYNVTVPTIAMQGLLTLTGTLFQPGGTTDVGSGVNVTATNGSTTLTDDTDADGKFSITGLDSDTDGSSLDWTLTAEVIGQGSVDTTDDTFTVEGDTASPATKNLVLVPNDVLVTITVYDERGTAATTPIAGATVTLPAGGTTSYTTNSNGVIADGGGTPVTFSVPENATGAALSYTVAAGSYEQFSGTLPAFTSRADLTAEAGMTALVNVKFTSQTSAGTPLAGTQITFNGSTQTVVLVDNPDPTPDTYEYTFAGVPTDAAAAWTAALSGYQGAGANVDFSTVAAGGTIEITASLAQLVSYTFVTSESAGNTALAGVSINFNGADQTVVLVDNGTDPDTYETTFTGIPVNAAPLTWTATLSGYDTQMATVSDLTTGSPVLIAMVVTI